MLTQVVMPDPTIAHDQQGSVPAFLTQSPASLVIRPKSVLQLHPLIEILAHGKDPRLRLRLFISQYFQVTSQLEKKLHCDFK